MDEMRRDAWPGSAFGTGVCRGCGCRGRSTPAPDDPADDRALDFLDLNPPGICRAKSSRASFGLRAQERSESTSVAYDEGRR